MEVTIIEKVINMDKGIDPIVLDSMLFNTTRDI